LKERLQAIQKVHRAGKRIPVEVRKLHEDDGEFFAERFAGAKKLGHYGVRVHQNPFVSDFLRCFQSEKKIRRSFVIPALHGGNGGNAIEGGVNFEGIEFRGVVREVVARLQARGIESLLPAFACEGGSAQTEEPSVGFRVHWGMIREEWIVYEP